MDQHVIEVDSKNLMSIQILFIIVYNVGCQVT